MDDTLVPEDNVQPDPVDPELPDEPIEPLIEPITEPEAKVHPLAPGGKRFEQVYAQGKQAQRDLTEERDRRIAAEAKLEVLSANGKSKTVDSEVEYSWSQLEEFITQGRITRADAEAHREEVRYKKLSSKLKDEFTKETRMAGRLQALQQGIQAYVETVPSLVQAGSPERTRLDQEFDWLVSVQGADIATMTSTDRKALELTALRNVLGPLDSLVKRTASPHVERHQGLPGGAPPRKSGNPDQALIDGLTRPQVEHYQKMFRAGRYPGKWKDVVEELKFTPGRKA